ncbi:MAG: SLBB domain-containing protein [Prolixibacteraceae bacterium]|nr:SLBB domain-containing protein [Prolixibacteraceae bacterium]
MKRLFFSLLILLPLAAAGQSSSMISMAQDELQKRGLNETEVRTRLLEEGIDVDNIPPNEYAYYRSRVTNILDKMQAEKAAATSATPTGVADTTTAPTYEEAFTSNIFPQTTPGEAAAEEALEESNISRTDSNIIYGHNLFTDNAMGVFRTTDGAQAPDTYVLGEGDEVHISIFGSSQTEIHQRIGADGSIQPAGSTKIFLKGLTLDKAREAIRSRLASHYSFRQDQIAVTITTARTISVSIYGEVGVQGGFTISALNTAFNALAAAGGPTPIGSVRNIQLMRSGKTNKLDLYTYMTNPDPKVQYDLQNNDVMFIPVAQKIVQVNGAVNRPMKYELIEGETLVDLLRYAGGLKYNVYPDFVQIERYIDGEKKYLEYDLNNVLSGTQKIDMQNGDIVLIRTANIPMENFVAINGDVYYGGSYDLEKNGSLLTLIENAKPTFTAKTDYVFVERTRPDETVEVLTVPFPGVNGNPDFTLQARDVVRVMQQSTYRDIDTIAVSGEVRVPFLRQFGLNDRMTISQAIEYAGGLKPNVFPVAYIFRKDLTNPDKMEYLRVSLETDGDMLLQPGDRLNVYDNSTYTNIGEIRINGAVKNPFGTAFDPSLTLHDLIAMAGGFEIGAAYDRVEIFRVNISNTQEVIYDLITLAVDENYNIKGEEFQLQPYDNIVVRMTPNFSIGRMVEVNGRVKYPGVYILEDNRTHLSEIIKLAGGLLDDADPYARLFRTYRNRGNIGLDLDEMTRRSKDIKSDPILMEGDVINVLRQENTVTIRETGTRMAQYVPEEFSSENKTVIYQGNRSAKWYIRHYAGGFQKTADKNSVTVTMPNNRTESVTKILGIRCYPKVYPGGTITLRIDQDKREKLEKEKEKINWDETLSRSLSSLTSIISIILLVDRLK